MSDIKLNRDFWDCECKDHYIKPVQQEYCGHCHTARIGQPHSRANEVERLNAQPQPKPQLQ